MNPRGASRALGHLANERGARTEERVIRIIRKALERGLLPDWVHDVRRATRQEDRNAADVVVGTIYGAMFIQVKTSDHGARGARGDRARALGVPVVVASRRHNDPEILGAVVEALSTLRSQHLARAALALRRPPPRRFDPPAPKPVAETASAPPSDPTWAVTVNAAIPFASSRTAFLGQATSLLPRRPFAKPVTFLFDSLKASRRGSFVVRLTDDSEHFLTDAQADPTSFPARVRATVTALHQLGHRGFFRISHEGGLVKVEPFGGFAASAGCDEDRPPP